MKAANLPGMKALKSGSRPNEFANGLNVAELNHCICMASLGKADAPTIKFSDGSVAECIEFKRDKFGDMTARVIGIRRFIHISDDMELNVHA